MSRVSVSDPCHRCGHRYSEHGAAHDTQCFCDQFIAAPDFEDKMLTTVENIEEQLKRLNATMDRIEPFLAANRPKRNVAAECRHQAQGWEIIDGECTGCGMHWSDSYMEVMHGAKNAPTTSQEAQQPREDLKPVVREGDEEFSALAASLYEALDHAAGRLEDREWARAAAVLRQYADRYLDYRAQQRDHDEADREDAER